MSPDPSHPEAPFAEIEAYLAGAMAGAERARFEARLAGDEALRGLVDAQRSVDAALRTAFAPPVAPALAAITGAAASKGVAAWLLSGTGLVTIAGAVAVAVGVIFGVRALVGPPAPADDLFTRVTAPGFVPTLVQSDPEQLAIVLSDKMGHTVRLRTSPRVRFVGLHSGVIDGAPLRVAVIADIDGRPAVLLIEPGTGEASAVAPAGVRMHTGRAGSLRMVELSPLAEPVLIPLVTAD
jgi:anti-sigma factor RsiW